MRKIVVKEKYNNKKLSSFLMDNFNGLTLSTFYKALRKKDIRINNIKINSDCILNLGDEITVYILDKFLFKTLSIKTIYEDNNILIVNKPDQLEVVNNNYSLESLTSILSNTYSEIYPCHRIDRNTKGLVLFAKNQKSLNILLNCFKNMEIEKHYLATVYGIPNPSSTTLIAYLFKDTKKSLVYINDVPKKGYQKIVTSYSIVSTDIKNNTCILDITLHTGRTHQIRAHLAHIGYPIIGDGKYRIKRN